MDKVNQGLTRSINTVEIKTRFQLEKQFEVIEQMMSKLRE
jgi:hypothetical protein